MAPLDDTVVVKPYAGSVFHAIQYLPVRQTREQLERSRAYGGVQSTVAAHGFRRRRLFNGSIRLGVVMTTFAALVQDYRGSRGHRQNLLN